MIDKTAEEMFAGQTVGFDRSQAIMYYESDFGTIDVGTASAETLRRILHEVVASKDREIQELRRQRNRWMEDCKPRCFLCRLFN